jgi:DNA-binding winged helix-turn-helix (wHTH) protein/TolB-like protein/Tfp pilus assembly protein PilF
MLQEEKELYEFGDFRLDVSERTLVHSDGQNNGPLPEKAFETLCILVRNGGHLLSKEEMISKVWPDSFVEENNLDKCIHVIRHALGEKPGEQKYVATVRKHGYRFVAQVTKVSGAVRSQPREHPADQERPLPKRNPRVILFGVGFLTAIFLIAALSLNFPSGFLRNANKTRSIAVLPLRPISSSNRDELYDIGIAESLIHKLSATKSLVVRPLSATRKYADSDQEPLASGREQKADYVLASNYQLAEGKIRITSQLINVLTGEVEETYKSDKDAAQVFAVQDAITSDITNILLRRFSIPSNGHLAKRGTEIEEAYRLYLQGRNLTYTRNAPDSRKAIKYLEQSVTLDPNFARGYSGLAFAYIASGNLGGGLPREEYEKARGAVTKALELDSNLAEANRVLAELKFTYEWDFAGGEKDLEHAMELEPNSESVYAGRATLLAVRGRFDEALTAIDTALEIDPNVLSHQRDRGRILYLARRYDEAILQLQRVVEVDRNFTSAYFWLWLACEMNGDTAHAYEWFLKTQSSPEQIELYKNTYEASGWQAVKQKVIEAEKQNQQKPGSNHYRLARYCALSDEKEQAFEYLNSALEKRNGQVVMINVEPAFDVLRGDPRFDELVRRVGLK